MKLRTLYFSNWAAPIFLFAVIVLVQSHSCNAGLLDKQLTITRAEKEILVKFRNEVSDDLPHDYMKTEVYLIKWLREAKFDVNEAKKRLQNNLIWRAENRMDEILSEDFSEFEREYPFWYDGVDYENRPVATVDLADWDARRAIITGQADKYYRFLLYNMEKGSVLLRELQGAGKNVTQIVVILNVQGFNAAKHACLRCITLYINFLITIQNNYAGQIHKFFIINTPSSYHAYLRIAYPFFTPESKGYLRVYGVNQKEWQKAILEVVPADQIRSQFGGTKSTEFD